MTRASHDYAPFYCEENVLRLLPGLGPEAFAVLVTSAKRSVAMRHQRAGGPPTGVVLWDYHAFALARREEWMAWDLDSTLPWPVSAAEYLRRSFVAEGAEDAPLFRVVAAGDYLRLFRSDRSHMRTADGAWTAPPPAWPAPDGAGGARLADLLQAGHPLGEWLSLEAMRERWRR